MTAPNDAAQGAAAAAYEAGFRGWPLVIMTAIAGRESSWDPTSNHIDSKGPQYSSYGYWQIEGSNLPGLGTSPSQMDNPVENAKAAFHLVGGNSLSGLSNWALADSPKSGVVPQPIYTSGVINGVTVPINYSIAQYLPEATTAARSIDAKNVDSIILDSSPSGSPVPACMKGLGTAPKDGKCPDGKQLTLGRCLSQADVDELVACMAKNTGVSAPNPIASAITGAASSLLNLATGLFAPFVNLFKALTWITQPLNWLRIFAGVAGLLFGTAGVVALVGVF